MIIEEQMSELAISPLQIGSSMRASEESQSEEPSQRKFHSAVIHKNSLYVYGGLISGEVSNEQTEQLTIYRYNITSKVWTRG